MDYYGPSSLTHKKFLQCRSDYVLFGGGAGCGKSHQALLLVLQYKDDPNFRGVFIRETSTQLSQAGGLFQEAQKMWKVFGCTFKSHPQMTARFPSGAEVQFKVCGSDRDISNYDGGQFSLVVFDEAQNHTDVQIRYLESRIRSSAKGPHQLIATFNPKRNSHLMPFVNWYLDQDTGIPLPERSGTERYYASYMGTMVFGSSREELEQEYPGVKAQSYTFISATIRDNPLMKKLNPGYVARLENLKRVERERLLLGSWFAKESTSGYFKREWVEIIDKPPVQVINRARGLDIAASLASESNSNPDFTASVMGSRTASHYVVEHVERYRQLPHGVLENIIKTDRVDKGMGYRVPIFLPEDPGAGGKHAFMFMSKHLIENGCDIRKEPSSGHNSKFSRMQPFLSLCEAGHVQVVRGDWNEMWFNELEDYVDGNRQQKDDMWDATAVMAKALMRQNVLPTFVIPSLTQPSPIPTL